jgi:hypothetical protein
MECGGWRPAIPYPRRWKWIFDIRDFVTMRCGLVLLPFCAFGSSLEQCFSSNRHDTCILSRRAGHVASHDLAINLRIYSQGSASSTNCSHFGQIQSRKSSAGACFGNMSSSILIYYSGPHYRPTLTFQASFSSLSPFSVPYSSSASSFSTAATLSADDWDLSVLNMTPHQLISRFRYATDLWTSTRDAVE